MSEQNEREKLLFLNTPISEEIQDVVGVNVYVEKLCASIDSGAQMIAVTSPFGSGKTSISELFEQRRKSEKREKIIKVSMWSQLHGMPENGSTTDLHRAFIYQVANRINHKRGTYINRRLSPNYSLLKIHANKKRYWVLFLISILLLLFSWALHTFPENLKPFFPFLGENSESWITVTTVVGALIGLISVTTAEIILSFRQKEGKREIESTEVIDLYRAEILKYRNKIMSFFEKRLKKKLWGNRYVIIIEDLDRTADKSAVISFLKELRKYYVPDKNSAKGEAVYLNEIVFVINVMPEAILCQNSQNENDKESLYAKLFDFVLNLQIINVDNYDAILEGILQGKKEQLRMLGFSVEGTLSELPGMKWIIRERRLGIREIKERLNIAFSLYEALKSKFPGKTIAFEKCAVVAYLTSAFEQDFYKTDDRDFQKLIYLFLQNKLTEAIVTELLKNASPEYVKTVKEMIEAKLIDSNYRTYFYNYPKGSYLYSLEEMQVMNCILYAEQADDIEETAKSVLETGSKAIKRAFSTLRQLGLRLPGIVFTSKTLFVEALKESKGDVFKYFRDLDYIVAKTVDFYNQILSYDENRTVYNKEDAEQLTEIWKDKYKEETIMQLRMMLCKEFSAEILWYKPLFCGVYPLITKEEMEQLSLCNCVELINISSEEFDEKTVEYVIARFAEQEKIDESESQKIEFFLRSCKGYLSDQLIASFYLRFMDKMNYIVPDFEDEIYELINNENTPKQEREELFSKYQQIINKTAGKMTKQTAKYVAWMARYQGYCDEVAEKLYQYEYFIDYVLIILNQGRSIDFEDEKIKSAIEEDIEWLIEQNEYFMGIRGQLVQCHVDLLMQYLFMFSEDCPVMTRKELNVIEDTKNNSDDTVLRLVPAKLVTKEVGQMLGEYFSRKKQGNKITYAILKYISTFPQDIAESCFCGLDFDMIQYKRIAADKKIVIKTKFANILKLNSASGKIRFMETTKFLDPMFEAELITNLQEDADLRKMYINVVNSSDSIKKSTIQTLCRLGTIYPMSPLVNEKLLENKKYLEYVVSHTLYNNKFEIDEGEHREELWPVYIKIFSDEYYPRTRKCMCENKTFIYGVMHNKAYTGFNEESRMQIKSIYQDKDSIIDVFSYGTDFALEYYSSMGGFENEEAATAFIDIIEGSPELIASDRLGQT